MLRFYFVAFDEGLLGDLPPTPIVGPWAVWRTMKRSIVSVSILVILAMTAAACSSSSKAASPATTASPTGGSAATTKAPSGTPYDLMFTDAGDGAIVPSYLAAIADGVNSRGGIHGRPLRIEQCVDHNDANLATACARQAVADKNMLATITNDSTCSSELLPILEQAHMASLGDQFFCPEDYKSSVVFPFDAGDLTLGAGAALAAEEFHSNQVVQVTIGVPAGEQGTRAIASVLGSRAKVPAVYLPLTAADLSPFAAQIVHDGGPLIYGLPQSTGIRLEDALKLQGYSQPILFNPTTFDAETIKANFGDPTNAYLISAFNLSSPGWNMFNADMQKYAPNATYRGSDLLISWLAANIAAREANAMSDPTASGLLADLSSGTSINTYGLTAPLNYTAPATFLSGEAPRVSNPCVALYHYTNGTWTLNGSFMDTLDPPASAKACS